MNQRSPSRRQFLKTSAVTVAAAAVLPFGGRIDAAQAKRPRVAAIYTLFRHRSHAHVILEKFLRPYLFNGKRITPPVEVVSFYADQIAKDGDMTHDVAKQFAIPVCKTIGEALCLGGKELAVDAVLSIGEHGDYPVNKLGQREYPRKRFFDESVAVMRQSKRFVPLFNDKHLSFRWDWAREMYDTAQKLKIPLMAGSSVPLAQRIPPLELKPGTALEEAVSIHGGPPESYDFHGLEVLQSLVEFRKGGETGISSVQFLEGAALWQAAKERRWSVELAEAALAAELGKEAPPLPPKGWDTHGILLTYRDGFRATVLKIGASSVRWSFAYRASGDKRIHATRYYVGPWGNRNLFMALSHAIQHHFVNRQAPYAVERTLLTTGVCDALMQSRAQKGSLLKTPHLEFAYTPRDFTAMREMGASWKVLPEGTPEPKGINPIGDKK